VAKNPEGSKWIGVDEKYATKGKQQERTQTGDERRLCKKEAT